MSLFPPTLTYLLCFFQMQTLNTHHLRPVTRQKTTFIEVQLNNQGNWSPWSLNTVKTQCSKMSLLPPTVIHIKTNSQMQFLTTHHRRPVNYLLTWLISASSLNQGYSTDTLWASSSSQVTKVWLTRPGWMRPTGCQSKHSSLKHKLLVFYFMCGFYRNIRILARSW